MDIPFRLSLSNAVKDTVAAWPAVCLARLPRSGIGNLLLVWSRAALFAHANGLPLVATGLSVPRIGPWLRREARKRVYATYFKPYSPIAQARALIMGTVGDVVREPALGRLAPGEARRGRVFVFEKLPASEDYFAGLRDEREFVRLAVHEHLSRGCRDALARAEVPVIGLHVRRGDFQDLKPGEDLATAMRRTPIEYFCRMVDAIRRVRGEMLPATIFSDGFDDELRPLLAMPRVSRAPRRPDVVDMLTLARSRVIVTSAWSTFSLWAVFLADAPALLHPAHKGALTRPEDVRAQWFEGIVGSEPAEWPELLVENLRRVEAGPS